MGSFLTEGRGGLPCLPSRLLLLLADTWAPRTPRASGECSGPSLGALPLADGGSSHTPKLGAWAQQFSPGLPHPGCTEHGSLLPVCPPGKPLPSPAPFPASLPSSVFDLLIARPIFPDWGESQDHQACSRSGPGPLREAPGPAAVGRQVCEHWLCPRCSLPREAACPRLHCGQWHGSPFPFPAGGTGTQGHAGSALPVPLQGPPGRNGASGRQGFPGPRVSGRES